uniref:Secreted protein n=1 Tax=Panagrellus redivivus TaxID=6233 RepID=A0A7E4ZYZ6_PANRE
MFCRHKVPFLGLLTFSPPPHRTGPEVVTTTVPIKVAARPLFELRRSKSIAAVDIGFTHIVRARTARRSISVGRRLKLAISGFFTSRFIDPFVPQRPEYNDQQAPQPRRNPWRACRNRHEQVARRSARNRKPVVTRFEADSPENETCGPSDTSNDNGNEPTDAPAATSTNNGRIHPMILRERVPSNHN